MKTKRSRYRVMRVERAYEATIPGALSVLWWNRLHLEARADWVLTEFDGNERPLQVIASSGDRALLATVSLELNALADAVERLGDPLCA